MFSTVAETASRLRRSVTIEPVVMLYLTAIGLNEVIRPNLLLDKACVQKLKYNRCGTGTFRELLLVLLSLLLLLLPLLTKKSLTLFLLPLLLSLLIQQRERRCACSNALTHCKFPYVLSKIIQCTCNCKLGKMSVR